MGKKSKKEEIYEYVWLIHFAIQQKLTQQCKATILQSKQQQKNISVMFDDCNWIKVGINKRKTMKKNCEKCPLEIRLLVNLTNHGVFTEGDPVSVLCMQEHFKEVTRAYFHWQQIDMNSSDMTKRHIESKPKFLPIQTKHGRKHFAMNISFNWV